MHVRRRRIPDGAIGTRVAILEGWAPHDRLDLRLLSVQVPTCNLHVEHLLVWVELVDAPRVHARVGAQGREPRLVTRHLVPHARELERVESRHVHGQEHSHKKEMILDFMWDNHTKLRELSLRMCLKIADLVKGKKIQGISDIVDLSDGQNGTKVVVEIKNGYEPGEVLENLYRLTPMEDAFSINAVALVAGKPQTLGLKELLQVFIDHRIEVFESQCISEEFLFSKVFFNQSF